MDFNFIKAFPAKFPRRFVPAVAPAKVQIPLHILHTHLGKLPKHSIVEVNYCDCSKLREP